MTAEREQAHRLARMVRDQVRDELGIDMPDEELDTLLRFSDLCEDLSEDCLFQSFLKSQMFAWLSPERRKQLVREMEQWAAAPSESNG